MSRLFLFSVLIILLCLVSLSLAAIPKLINYQGMLTQSDGITLVVNANYSILFKIYNASSSGTLKWSHTYSVSVINGLFNVVLGDSSAPIDLPFDEDYWLEITVGGNTLSPRTRLTSVGYAYRAEKADTATYARSGPWGGDNAWTFRITDTADTTLMTGGRWGIARYGNVLYGSMDSTHVNLGAACTTGTSGQNYKYCTVGGGILNTASLSYTTVGGGYSNTASGNYATVAGGYSNTASGAFATVGGGDNDTASGECATVPGGGSNTASGEYATVAGGRYNTASGDLSFAAGFRAKANHTGTFVWADYTIADFASTKTHQFSIRAGNGVRLASDAGSGKTIDIGERYRDNAIVAWGKVSSGGTLSADFGVTSVTNDSTGAYTITLDAAASDAATLIPIAQAEVESPGTIRIVSVNQTSTKVFEVYINNSSFNRVNNDFVFMVTAR
jgi:hypothetical protein